MPPLVFAGECDTCAPGSPRSPRGEAFLLQGGDCAETFDLGDRRQHPQSTDARRILQMAVVLTYGASVPVVKVGRMAGQYAKPRSSNVETRDGRRRCRPTAATWSTTSPSRRSRGRPTRSGWCAPTTPARATLNLVRAFTQGGFADLRQVHDWNTGFVANSANARYERIARDIDQALRFMARLRRRLRRDAQRSSSTPPRGAAAGLRAAADPHRLPHRPPVRRVGALRVGGGAHPPARRRAHRLRLADRTTRSASRSAPTTTPDDLLRLIDTARPRPAAGPADVHHPDGRGHDPRGAAADRREGHRLRRPGRLDLRPDARQHLRGRPPATRPAASTTSSTRCGASSRSTGRLGTCPGGIHIELTGDDVTECLGGVGRGQRRRPGDSATRPLCDPRLNHQQSPGAGVPRRGDAARRRDAARSTCAPTR